MSQRNENTRRANDLIAEYVGLHRLIEDVDAECHRLHDSLRACMEKTYRLVERQEKLADVLGPALSKSGPIHHQAADGTRYAIADDPDESILSVTKLAPAHTLELAPRFTADEIRDAAFREAVRSAFSDPDDYSDTIRLPGREASIRDGVYVIDQEVG